MASGSKFEEVARADRMRERQAQERKATRNGLNNLRAKLKAGELPYREEMDSHSEVTVGFGEKLKVGAKGIPPKSLGVALIILSLAAAVVAVLRAL